MVGIYKLSDILFFSFFSVIARRFVNTSSTFKLKCFNCSVFSVPLLFIKLRHSFIRVNCAAMQRQNSLYSQHNRTVTSSTHSVLCQSYNTIASYHNHFLLPYVNFHTTFCMLSSHSFFFYLFWNILSLKLLFFLHEFIFFSRDIYMKKTIISLSLFFYSLLRYSA